MLKSELIHPEILKALAGAGHGSKVLIADGNFPFSTKCGPKAALVYLNLAPGMLSATDVLAKVVTAIPVEAAAVMQPADGKDAPIFAEFQQLAPQAPLQRLERFAFYDAASGSDTCLVIATGEQRIYANILLTIGVVLP